jgi:hypothetical protein
MTEPLRFVSEDVLRSLRLDIHSNLERYRSGAFTDLAKGNGWSIETRQVRVDVAALEQLNMGEQSAATDAKNSKIIYGALSGMTPAIATEERLWVRLSHIECLRYGRSRWLEGVKDEDLAKQVQLHLFAAGRTGVRDDNALSRLWWNMHVATLADPEDPHGALDVILTRADLRMQLVERPNTAARPSLARAIVRGMRREPDLAKNDSNFRDFMKIVNREGGGILFETWRDPEIDSFISRCVQTALAAK